MKLTINNFDKPFKIRNWEVYEAEDTGTHYNFYLCGSYNTNHHVAVSIKRTPTLVSQKIQVSFEVSIAYEKYGSIFYTEDVSLRAFKDKDKFWQSVEELIVDKIK